MQDVPFIVRPEMDTGPILGQAAVPVLDDDTPDTLEAYKLATAGEVVMLTSLIVTQ